MSAASAVGSGFKTMMTDAAHRSGSLEGTPVRRQLGTSTDDAAIFLEDTVDRATAQCIDASPSALALLTPQRLPAHHNAHVDVTEYDASHLGSLAASHRRSGGENSHPSSNSSSKSRLSGPRAALHDVTNTSGHKLNFSAGVTSKSPTPKAARVSTSHLHSSGARVGSHNSSLCRSTPRRSKHDRSPSAAEPMVPLADFEALQKERNRFEKMYEHQRALYEEMAEKQADTYQTLQDKIIEVVALSTRNEESKRFIRQLKREFSESRTRVMDMQNKALEEAKAERNLKSRYEALIQEHERKYDRLAERHETKLAGMESLIKDLTCLRGEQDQLHVSQLDSLLKAAYAKSTALFSDLMRQGRQIDLLYDAKCDLEGQLEQLRREKREMEATLRDDRRRMMSETERLIEQIEEQQQSILNLRQMLIRTMDNRDNVFAYSRGPRAAGHNEERTNENDGGSSSSSFSSSPSSIAEDAEEDRSFGLDDLSEDDPLHGESTAANVAGVRQRVYDDDAHNTQQSPDEEEEEEEEDSPAPLPLTPAVVVPASRSSQSRPVISTKAATAPALASNTVVTTRRSAASAVASLKAVLKPSAAVEVPPLPLSSRGSSASSSASAGKEQPYRIQRSGGDAQKERYSENNENSNGEERPRTASGGVLREQRVTLSNPLLAQSRSEQRHSTSSDAAKEKENDRDVRDSSSSPLSAAAASRRRLDFSTALAAVTEKRRRDREAREDGAVDKTPTSSGKTSTSGRSNENSSSGGGIATAKVISTSTCKGKREAEKENGGRRMIVRSGAVGSIATARAAAGSALLNDEDEEEPRLFQRAGLSQRE